MAWADILYGSIVVTRASALITFPLSSHYFTCICTTLVLYFYSELLDPKTFVFVFLLMFVFVRNLYCICIDPLLIVV